jgi:1-acyl-sn-glycerol-3-phosphate acyltransferase
VWCAKVLCGIEYRVEGLENLPKRPFIVASKHSSTWETLFLASYFAPSCFIAKQELMWLPFFGWAFALSSPIMINRKAGAQAMAQMIAQSEHRIKIGFNFVIFPEGTRIAAGVAGKYKSGCARLAIGLADKGYTVPILPVAHNAGYLWPKSGFLKYPGTLTVRFLPVLSAQNITAPVLTQQLETVIEAAVNDMGKPV